MLVGLALGIVPVARDLDDLPGRDLDAFEPQFASGSADDLGDGIGLKGEDLQASVPGLPRRLLGDKRLDSFEPSVYLARPVPPRRRRGHRNGLAVRQGRTQRDIHPLQRAFGPDLVTPYSLS